MIAAMRQMSLFLSVLLLFATGNGGGCEAWTSWSHMSRLPFQTLALEDLRITAQTYTKDSSQSHSTRLKMADSSDTEEDWRDFRARLVAQEQKTTDKTTISSPAIVTDSTWAYELGSVIEEGCVILSRHEHDFCYGLKQQYFHKSIMLVLEHEDATITDGIILNRPTSRVMTDKDGNSWNIWYGGPVRGMDDDNQEGLLAFTCLHSLTNNVAKRVSNKIIKQIQWTTLDAAQFLVREGHAVPEDFQVYCGFAAWSPGQLQKELERNNWYMASVDSQTILQELLNRPIGDLDVDPFGLDTWRKLSARIGRVGDTTTEAAERFDDCMLLEWIRAHLLKDGDEARVPLVPPTRPPGTILRASGPFLLDNQEFHKSLLLVLEDTPAATTGVILNLPGTECISIGDESIPVRYGGKFGVHGQLEKPVTWYHNDASLRAAQVGSPAGTSKTGIWTCTREDAETAIEIGLASLDDFLVVQGATVFPKKNDVDALAALEKFEVLSRPDVPQVWDALLSQEGVTRDTLNEYMDIASSIWALSAGDEKDSLVEEEDGSERDLTSMAWKSWVITFLLRDPKLRGS